MSTVYKCNVVESISTLRSVSKSNHTHIFVTGYYAPGDGGGGPYYLDAADTTSLDNGGSIIVASDGGCWKLINNGQLHIRQFGAKPDGSDAGPAINAAIGALPPSGGTILFDAALFSVSTSITVGDGAARTVSSRRCIRLIGAGSTPGDPKKGTVLKWAGGSGAGACVLKFLGQIEGCEFSGITIDCNRTADSGMELWSISFSSFDKFAVLNFTKFGIAGNCYEPYAAGAPFWSANNTFKHFLITSDVEGSCGIVLNGYYTSAGAKDLCDWHRNCFICGVVQIKKSSDPSVPSSGAWLKFCDSSTFIECDIGTYGSGAGYGLHLDGTNHDHYPANHFFYGCSIIDPIRTTDPTGTIGYTGLINHPMGDGEPLPMHPKIYGFNDHGIFFGGDSFTVQRDVPSLLLSNRSANKRWRLVANNTDFVFYGVELQVSTNYGTWTSMFRIDDNGDTYVNFPGTGLKRLELGPPDSAGTGYRVLRTPNN